MIDNLKKEVLSDYQSALEKSAGSKVKDIKVLQLRNLYAFLEDNHIIINNFYELWSKKSSDKSFLDFLLMVVGVEKDIHQSILDDIESSPIVSGMSKSSVSGEHLYVLGMCEDIENFFSAQSNRNLFEEYFDYEMERRQAM